MKFGQSKGRLALVLFTDKANDGLENSQISGGKRTVNLELTQEEEQQLDKLSGTIDGIKKIFPFVNLKLYLNSVSENFDDLNDRKKKNDITVKKIKKFLDGFVIPKSFGQIKNLSNVNMLNFKDERFISRFDSIITVV